MTHLFRASFSDPWLIPQIGPELGWISNHHGDEDLYDQATKGPRADNGVESMWQPPKPATEYV